MNSTKLIQTTVAGILSLVGSYETAATTSNLIPQPRHIKVLEGGYTITSSTCLQASEVFAETAQYFRDSIGVSTGFGFLGTASDAGCIVFEEDESLPKEGYSLQVTANGIRVSARTGAGAFYAVQTIRQLMPAAVFASMPQPHVQWYLPGIKINDEPAFMWRGMMLDVGRHFMPKEFVMKFLDLMALHKMNKFHWHLTEDQGWRIEIRRYPRLTEVGSHRSETLVGHFRDGMSIFSLLPWAKYDPDYYDHEYDGTPYGGYYTQEEIREVVEYAESLHIDVVPEIEMPGHAQAAIAAYPELGTTGEPVAVKKEWGVSHQIFSPEEATIEFLKKVLSEVMDLFPGEYIHIGGDEAEKLLWEKSSRVQELIAERGLADEDEMQAWFIAQINTYLTANGRKMIGWDEILEGGLAEGATVMSWRGADGGIEAAKSGHDVIMAEQEYTYFDFYQSKNKDREPLAIHGYTPLKKVYEYSPMPQQLSSIEQARIIGVQGQLWTEYIDSPKHVEYMAFPRAIALSEVMWLNRPTEDRSFSDFSRRLVHHLRRLDQLGVNYRPLDLLVTGKSDPG